MKIDMRATNARFDDNARPEVAPPVAKVMSAIAAWFSPIDGVLQCSFGV